MVVIRWRENERYIAGSLWYSWPLRRRRLIKNVSGERERVRERSIERERERVLLLFDIEGKASALLIREMSLVGRVLFATRPTTELPALFSCI